MELSKELSDELSRISKEQVEECGKKLPQIIRISAEDKIFVPDDLRSLHILILQKCLSFYGQLLSNPDSCVLCSKNNCRFRVKEDLLRKIEFLQNLFLSELRERLSISIDDFPNILIGRDFEVFKFAGSKESEESELIVRIVII